MSHIELYDFASREPSRCWAYNPWKIRLVLNYKNIPYKTVWVDHNNISSKLKALNVPANTSGRGFEYTVPTVILPGGSVVTDSAVIVKKLEAMYPSPPLPLDTDLETEVSGIAFQTVKPLLPMYIRRMSRDVILESTVPTFEATRETILGMPFAEAQKLRSDEQAWKDAEEGLMTVKKILTERKQDEGPWIRGSQMCYADLMLVAFFQTLRRAGEDFFEKVMAWDNDGVFRRFYETAAYMTVRDQ